MEKGAKIGLVVGWIIVAIAAGFGIYYATRPKATETGGGNTGGDTGGNTGGGGTGLNIAQIQNIIGNVANALKEKFPFRVGMYGPNIKSMQTALRTKFNQLSVKSDGIFGVKTLNALKATGYATGLTSTIDDEQFLDIIDGKKMIG